MTDGKLNAIVADHVFDGDAVHRDCAVVLAGDTVRAVLPCADLPGDIAQRRLAAGLWLAPGFIDTQVNGGGDVLFNDQPTPDGIAAIARAHRRFGTTALLPTLITDTDDTMRAALHAVQEAAARHPGILGIHLEGPLISPQKPGIHDPARIRGPRAGDIDLLASLEGLTTLVTLAPERVPAGFISDLTRRGVRVSLGHSAATYHQTLTAMGEGLTGFTHLFNAMPPLASREPGPIAAALERADVWFGMIVDGAHVDPAMLRLALRGHARAILVTDAMPPVGGERSSFRLQGRDITLKDGRCTGAHGTLAGAALDMASAVRNSMTMLGLPLEQALRLASTEPAAFLGLAHRLGRLAPGYRADMVAFEPVNVRVIDTWVAGVAGP